MALNLGYILALLIFCVLVVVFLRSSGFEGLRDNFSELGMATAFALVALSISFRAIPGGMMLIGLNPPYQMENPIYDLGFIGLAILVFQSYMQVVEFYTETEKPEQEY